MINSFLHIVATTCVSVTGKRVTSDKRGEEEKMINDFNLQIMENELQRS